MRVLGRKGTTLVETHSLERVWFVEIVEISSFGTMIETWRRVC